jgi:prepilin-type N-terminal cleavage/methylation domain-containing protein
MHLPRSNRNAGFTLVEIALALLVASIGLLGLFTLFPAGVQMNKTAVDETQAALFADQIMNGIRAQTSIEPWNQVKTAVDLPPPTPDVWSNPNELRVRVTPGGSETFETLRYTTAGALGGTTAGYTDFGVRYRLEIDQIANSLRYAVRLKVRPGEFGTTNTYVFYTELYNHGQN